MCSHPQNLKLKSNLRGFVLSGDLQERGGRTSVVVAATINREHSDPRGVEEPKEPQVKLPKVTKVDQTFKISKFSVKE